MKQALDGYLEKLVAIFRNNDFRVAHEKSKEVMIAMAKDNDALFEIIRRNLSAPGFFSKNRINPVIAFDIIQNKDFSIAAHCWMPLPDRDTAMTHQSIHHHGRLLLTSVAPFGDGYESVIFKQGYEIDKVNDIAKMNIEKIYKNPRYNIEFVDSHTPHVVFYPAAFSITYAMWSYDKKDGMIATLRQSKFVQANKKTIIKLMRSLGVLSKAGVNTVEYFDFYPDGEKVNAMKDRVMYPVGGNENFVHNIFYILQQVGFSDKAFIEQLKNKMTAAELVIAEKPMNKYLNDEPIQDVFDPVHLNIPKINFKKDVLLKSV